MPGPIYHPVATGAAHDTTQSMRTWAVLEAKGIPYKYREVNPYLKEKDFLDTNAQFPAGISPHALTPGLYANSRPLHDSTIINEFLEEAGQTLGADPTVPSLWPKEGGAYAKARARLWIDHINKAVVPAFIRLLQAGSSETQETALQEWTTALSHITAHCQGPFFYGQNISLVDLAIAPWTVRDFILCEKSGFVRDSAPGWAAWAEALKGHPAVQRTTSDPAKYLEFNQTFMQNEDHSVVGKAARTGQEIL